MIVDANVLIYAVDSSSSHHREASDWLESALSGPERVGLPWVSLIAFQRICTNPRLFDHPLSPAAASDLIDAWAEHPNTWIPTPSPNHAHILRMLTVNNEAVGNLVTDAHLAALAIQHGTSVCSFDRDFARFHGVQWVNPLDR